jgi:hypothetical protein
MIVQPVLLDHEVKLLLELLRRERNDLPHEHRHTKQPALRDELDQRMRIIDGLVEKLSVPACK